MRALVEFKRTGFAVIMALVCTGASAQYRHSWHRKAFVNAPSVVVVNRTAPAVRIDNQITQKERLDIVVAYLKSHQYINASRYAKITNLHEDVAAAELEVFALHNTRHITKVIVGKNVKYTLRG